MGNFTMKSAYIIAFDERNCCNQPASSAAPNGGRACWKVVWGGMVPPEVKDLRRICRDQYEHPGSTIGY